MKLIKLLAIACLAVTGLHCTKATDTNEPTAGSTAEQPEKETPSIEPPAMAEADVPGPAPAIDVDIESLALKVDPVCKMSLEEYPITAITEYNDGTYGFCAEICKKKFVAEPEKMLARIAAMQEPPAE